MHLTHTLLEAITLITDFLLHAGVKKTASSSPQTTTDHAVSAATQSPDTHAEMRIIQSHVSFFLSDDRGSLELRKTTDYGRSFQTIATRVYSFVLGGRFVFASIMTGTVCVENVFVLCVWVPFFMYVCVCVC